MMSITDIIQLVLLCALLFIPLGYLLRKHARRIEIILRLTFFRPRFIKPEGVLHRQGKNKK